MVRRRVQQRYNEKCGRCTEKQIEIKLSLKQIKQLQDRVKQLQEDLDFCSHSNSNTNSNHQQQHIEEYENLGVSVKVEPASDDDNQEESTSVRASTGYFRYQCMKEFDCPASFKSFQEIKLHLAEIHGWKKMIRFCKRCGLVFKSQIAKYDHIREEHSFHCSLCNEKFRRELNYLEHVRNQHNMVASVPCSVCGQEFESTANLITHIIKEHGLISSNGTRLIWQCKKCGSNFLSLKRKESHIRARHRYECYNCGSIFKSHKALECHRSSEHEPINNNLQDIGNSTTTNKNPAEIPDSCQAEDMSSKGKRKKLKSAQKEEKKAKKVKVKEQKRGN